MDRRTATAFVAGALASAAVVHAVSAARSTPRERGRADPAGAVSALQASFAHSALALDDATIQRFCTSWGSVQPAGRSLAVVFVMSTREVQLLVSIAKKYSIVLIPVAGRTALEGQFLPTPSTSSGCGCSGPSSARLWAPSAPKKEESKKHVHNRPTIHVSFERMDSVVAIHAADSQAIVQPGVGWVQLNAALAEQNIPLHFPVDPAPGACFGGMVAVGGSGTNAVGHGTMRSEWVQGMEVVLMSGEVIRTNGSCRARKRSCGWDTGRLFLGSEGTLGIITEITIRLAPVIPLRVALTSFPSVAAAVATAIDILAAGLAPTSLELLDGTSVRGLNMAQILPYELPETPCVMMRFGAAIPAVAEEALRTVAGIVERHGGSPLRIAKDEEENEAIWKARKSQFWSQQLLVGEGCRTLITDVCVPLSRLAELVERSEQDVVASGLLAPIVAHIGDGNVHRAILYKPLPGLEEAAPPAVHELASKLSALAIELEGTCAGEHGIGSGAKRGYLEREMGKGTLDLMRDVKELLDPRGLLNPGKILFDTHEE